MTGVSIALLRGINVGGRNALPMAELREAVAACGGADAKTYIQSGNVVFRGAIEPDALAGRIAEAKGFRPHVLILPLERYDAILGRNPFPAASEQDGKSVHVFFAGGRPAPLSDETAALATGTEAVSVQDDALWLLAPDGIGRSRLAARLEKAAGVPLTARNWRSALAIRDLARNLARSPT